jgi:integrase
MIRKRPNGYEVWAYDPAIKRKRYIGTRKQLRGSGGAAELERDTVREYRSGKPAVAAMTCAQYAERWLDARHGRGTRRPATATWQVNRSALGLRKPGQPLRPGSFLAAFGDRTLDGGVSREEALDFSRGKQGQAKVIAAMYSDAVDDARATENPFANRRLPNRRGRRDIEPLTELEVTRLAELAVAAWEGSYGRVVAGWITFLAWTGCRPGEAAGVRWGDLDVERGLLTVPRIKGDKQTDEIVLPGAAVQALERMPEQRAAAPANRDRLFLTAYGKPYTIGSYSYYWRPVRAAFVAQLDPDRRGELQAARGALDVYALRHFTGSYMAARGANEFQIAAQLGNSPEVCRRTYIHTYREEVNERNRGFLAQTVADLDAARRREGA